VCVKRFRMWIALLVRRTSTAFTLFSLLGRFLSLSLWDTTFLTCPQKWEGDNRLCITVKNV